MKKNRTVARLALMLFAMFISSTVMAQKAKTTDKDLIGVWLMVSMKFEGQKEEYLDGDYGQIKVYRANGEYACAQIARISDTETMILPHEYGTYTYKNGKYTECGRNSIIIMVDKTHFEGPWQNRYDKWRKVTNMPAELVDYIVDKCKRRNDPKNIQSLTEKYILSTPKKK